MHIFLSAQLSDLVTFYATYSAHKELRFQNWFILLFKFLELRSEEERILTGSNYIAIWIGLGKYSA